MIGSYVRLVLDAWDKVFKEGRVREVCLCAAIWLDDGYVVRGHRHDDCIATVAKLVAAGRKVHGHLRQDQQGFLTSHGRFVSREEGARLQNEAGVVSAMTGRPIQSLLFSEDLY